ncbi:hypothetical protein PV327_007405 [Microctonus hyperodae]|uniref:Uncharacterized protein n=1 Tax=Microctonus hyperodae TaxID=165561 RepID=A0AA39KYF3_MICHY|nr:hypothetical protein PV327_007405 [Microctonus hyperodae]
MAGARRTGKNTEGKCVDPGSEDRAVGPSVENTPSVDSVPNVETPSINPNPLSERERITQNITRHVKGLEPRELLTLLDSFGLNTRSPTAKLTDRMIRYELRHSFAGEDIEWDEEKDLHDDGLPFSVAVWMKETSWESYGAPRIERPSGRRSVTWEDNPNRVTEATNQEAIRLAASSTVRVPNPPRHNREPISETIS